MKQLRLLLLLNSYRLYLRTAFWLNPKMGAERAIRLFSTPFNAKVRERETAVLAKAETEVLTYGSIPIRLYHWGRGEDRPLALLVHGWEGNAGSMGAFVEPLLAGGYRVIAFDGPAHGKSGGETTDLFHFAGFVEQLLDRYDIRVAITHSFGSAATTYALSRRPDRMIDRMVMITTPDRLEHVLQDFGRLMRLRKDRVNTMIRSLEMRYQTPVEQMQVSKLANQARVNQILLLHSEDDRVLPYENTLQVHRAVKHAQLYPVRGKGHYRILWDGEVVEQVGWFLVNGACLPSGRRAGS